MTTDELIASKRKYGLSRFREILVEIQDQGSSAHDFAGKSILELGPGHQLGLLRYFANETGAKQVTGVGRFILWPWNSHRAFRRAHVINAYILPWLKSQKPNSVDIIYSRHVMEQHSIHAGILLTSPVYRKYIKENRFGNLGADFPASPANIQAIFKAAFKLLKKDGVIVSQIAKSHFGALDDEFLKKSKCRNVQRRAIGKMSEIVTVRK